MLIKSRWVKATRYLFSKFCYVFVLFIVSHDKYLFLTGADFDREKKKKPNTNYLKSIFIFTVAKLGRYLL